MAKHSVKVPTSLKEHKEAIGAGIMYLAMGRFDVKNRESDLADLITVEFTLSAQSEQFLAELLAEHSKRKIFAAALAWVSRQPKHIQLSKI